VSQLTRRILGIDPGSLHLGIGLIEKKGARVRLLFAETIHAPAKMEFFERLDFIHLRLKARIEELKPEEIAVEDTFFAKNAQSAFKLGMARGVAVAACLGRGLRIYEYAPTQVKSVVTGYGRADKEQVRKMVGLSLGSKLDLGFDATDALAVALCHANSLNLGALTT
jgi:crossover junction endodeoxyribonuclease RuvC